MFKELAIILALVNLTHIAAKRPKPPGINNGEPANIQDYPYQVLILAEKHCGGALIASDIVISTAHCAKSKNDTRKLKNINTTVYAGRTIWKEGKKADVRKIVVHEDFDPVTRQNDIAIFFLARKLERSKGFPIKKIRISELFEELDSNSSAKITGWGSAKPDELMSKRLRWMRVTVIDNEICQKFAENLTDVMQFCTYNPETNRDAREGDLGGPLVIDNALVGLISEGKCTRKDHCPRVYTRAAAYRDWLNNETFSEKATTNFTF